MTIVDDVEAASQNDAVPADGSPKKRRMARRRAMETSAPEVDVASATAVEGDVESEDEATPQVSMDQLEAAEILSGARHLPRVVENVKSLGDLVAKYRIGDDPDFKLQVWRSSPKMFHGGIKADGYYHTYDNAFTEDFVRDEYGGGVYRIVVVGPNPTRANVPKHYDSISLNFPGEPRQDRVPRSVSDVSMGTQPAGNGQMMPMMQMPREENPKIVETTLNALTSVANQERAERHRAEDAADKNIAAMKDIYSPLIELHEKRADDVREFERSRAADADGFNKERLAEERAARQRLELELVELKANIMQPRENPAETFKAVADSLKSFGSGDTAAAAASQALAEKTMGTLMERHSTDMDRMSTQHQSVIDSMRQSHADEKRVLNEAASREVQSEREAGRRREERVEDQLKAEREERRRDQEASERRLKERDEQWQDRLSQQRESINQSWEARHQSTTTNFESRLLWLQSEIDRLKSENSELRQKGFENSDPLSIIQKGKEIKEAFGITDAAGSGGGSGGLGLSGGGDEWKSVLAEGFTERAPQLFDIVGRYLTGQPVTGPGQQQKQPKIGDVIKHPTMGVCVVVEMPDGQLGVTPKAEYDKYMAQQRQGGRSLGDGGQRRSRGPRVMSDVNEAAKKEKAKISTMPVPDLGYGLPQQKHRDEAPRVVWTDPNAPQPPQVQPIPQQPAQQQPPQQQRRSRPATEPSDGGVIRMTAVERQVINILGRLVHDAVSRADDPEEFVQKLISEQPPQLLSAVVTNYSPDDICKGIAAIHPTSAGTSPAGIEFIKRAFTLLAETIGRGGE